MLGVHSLPRHCLVAPLMSCKTQKMYANPVALLLVNIIIILSSLLLLFSLLLSCLLLLLSLSLTLLLLTLLFNLPL